MRIQVRALTAMMLMALGAAGCTTVTSAAGSAQPPSHSASSTASSTSAVTAPASAPATARGSMQPSPPATVSSTAATPPASAPARTLTSAKYAVTLTVPKSWTPTPGYAGRLAYSGTTGWVVLDAASDGDITATCQGAATGNVLHPYGRHPKIAYRKIDGRPGCVILPSAGAPRQSVRAGGPAFLSSAALAEYRHPVRIDGTTWPMLVIYADPAHLTGIVNSVQLHH